MEKKRLVTAEVQVLLSTQRSQTTKMSSAKKSLRLRAKHAGQTMFSCGAALGCTATRVCVGKTFGGEL